MRARSRDSSEFLRTVKLAQICTVHQIVCRLGLRPIPHWGSLQRSPRPLSWFKGDLLLRERGKKGEEEGKGGRGMEGHECFDFVVHKAEH